MSFASSTFTGTNGTELSASDAGWVRHAAASASGVNAQIANNRARISASSGNAYYYRSETPASADYTVAGNIVRRSGDSGSCGVVGRLDPSAATGILFQHDEGNGWRMFQIVGGSYSQLGTSVAQTLTIDQAYLAEAVFSGNTVSGKVNGVTVIPPQTTTVTAAGRAGINLYANGGGIGDVYNHHIDDFVATDAAAGDTTAPVLTGPVGTSTGTTTATVGATTDEGNGTLYAVVTASATAPSVAQIKAGQNHTGAAAAWSGSVAVSSTGAKTLNATGLTASTSYYAHLVHADAATNNSNVVSSAQFTTSSAAGTVTVSDALKNNTGTVQANLTGVKVAVLQASDLASVYEEAAATTNASGMLSAISNAAITTGQQYHVAIKTAAGGVGITGPITAT